MRLRKVVQLLDRAAEPDPEPLAPPERDQRVRQLVALAERVGERIEVGEDAVTAPGRQRDQQPEGGQRDHHEAREEAAVDPAQEQHAHRDRRDHDERPEVGLEQQQRPDHGHRRAHRQEALAEALHVVLLAHRVVGHVEHDEQLHQLRGLQVEDVQRQPAPRPVDELADAGDEHQHQQREPHHEQRRSPLLPDPHRHAERHRGQPPAERDREHVADQEVRRLVIGEARRVGQRDRRGIDHHQPEEQQRRDHPHQRDVDRVAADRGSRTHPGARGAPSAEAGQAKAQHGSPPSSASSRTATTKASARWA